MTTSPEERAKSVVRSLLEPLDNGKPYLETPLRKVMAEVIASAIRDAENEARDAVVRQPYHISKPEGGWRAAADFAESDKVKLRPIAETLAMLDGNAFFGNEAREGQEWYEMYLLEAHALYESNGGDSGWAGEASFARSLKHPKD